MWFKCAVKVDLQGSPVEKRNIVEPIFLETRTGNYSIEAKPINVDWNHSDLFKPEMFYTAFSGDVLINCRSNDPIVAKFNERLKAKVVAAISEKPFFAKVYNDLTIPDDEIWLKREYASSEVLNSTFIQEKSLYVIRWRFVNNKSGSILKFYVRHQLAISPGKNNTFNEPSDNQKSVYDGKINNIVSKAVGEVCEELNLIYKDRKLCNCK
jgi:hypothetical protein